MKIIRSIELPTRICLKCRAFLRLAYKFREIARHSDDFLREYIYKEPENEEDKQVTDVKPTQTYEQVEVEVLEEGIWCNDELIEDVPSTAVSVEAARLIVVPAKETITAPSASGKLHFCEICGNSYPRKSTLDTHMRRHNNERPYECE